MAKKASKKSTKSKSSSRKSTRKKAAKKSSRTSTKKSSSKKASTRTTSARSVRVTQPEPVKESGCQWCTHEMEDEHRVLSHLMYILFLIAVAISLYYTFNMFAFSNSPADLPMKALVLLGWAFLFKTFGHRIHHPYH